MNFPNFHICQLHTQKLSNDLLSIDKLEDYVPNNPQVSYIHSHGFYHFAFIISGSGTHTIDFKHFAVAPSSVYFMHPHQVHQWDFDADIKGYVINFSAALLEKGYIDSKILDVISLFKRLNEPEVYTLSSHTTSLLIEKLEALARIVRQVDANGYLYIAHALMDVLLMLNKELFSTDDEKENNTRSFQIYNDFLTLVDAKYKSLKLPHEYAEQLHLTLPTLNEVVKMYAHRTVGEVVRERVLLEAKRLLVNKDYSISQIAYELNFSDNSYFVKFFKKYIGITPEQFRTDLKYN